MGPRNPENTSGLRRLSQEKGSPAVDLASLTIPLAVLAVLPENVAQRLQLLPLRMDQVTLFVAMAEPADQTAIDEAAFLSGRKVVAYAANPSVLRLAMEEAYDGLRRGNVEWRGSRAASTRVARMQTPQTIPLDEATAAANAAARPVANTTGSHSSFGRHQPASTGSLRAALRQPDPPVPTPEISGPFAADSSYRTRDTSGDTNGRRRRILVVDDEPVICRIVHQALAQRGYEVHDAAGGMQALQLIKDQDPDAILLDAMLPDVHGFDIAKRLRESRRYNHIPIVMMTAVYKGWRMEADLKEAYGVYGCVEKPFNIHDVVKLLEDAIAGRPPGGAHDAAALSAEANRLFSDGMAAYRRGDGESAIAAMVSAAAIDPLSATLRQQLGLLYAWKGQDYAAIQELELAVELEPTRFAALRNLAVLFQRRGFRRKACEIWERALAHAPDDPTRAEIKQILVGLL